MKGSSSPKEAAPATTEHDATGEGEANADGFPPGPDGLPVIGSVHEFTSDPGAFYDRLAEYGDVVSYRFFGHDMVTVLHPDYVEQVLVTDADSFGKLTLSDFGTEFAPEGLLFAEGEQWRKQRTLAQPAFRLDRIRGYGDRMAEYAQEFVEEVDDGDVLVANERFSRLTLRILVHSLFDLDLDGEDRASEVITRAAHELNQRSDPNGLSTYLPEWVPTPANRRFRRAKAEVTETIDRLIADRRADLDEHDDLLTMLMQAGDDGEGMSDEELRDTMLTFLFAGHETTALVLTYTTYLLAEHPDVARRVEAELDEELGDDAPGVLDLPGLDYLDRVCTESMRLYPPAYVLFREAREDVTLGGYDVPEDTKLTVPQFRLHLDERWYDAPDEFRPDRWTDEFEAELPEYAYFPFGGGPRHCIGMRFATMELKLVLATLLQHCRFDYLGDEPPQPRFAATYQPSDDLRLRVERR